MELEKIRDENECKMDELFHKINKQEEEIKIF